MLKWNFGYKIFTYERKKEEVELDRRRSQMQFRLDKALVDSFWSFGENIAVTDMPPGAQRARSLRVLLVQEPDVCCPRLGINSGWDELKELTFKGYLLTTLPAASCSLKEGSYPCLPQWLSPVWAQIQRWTFSTNYFSPVLNSLARSGQQKVIREQEKRSHLSGLSSLSPAPAGKSCPSVDPVSNIHASQNFIFH